MVLWVSGIAQSVGLKLVSADVQVMRTHELTVTQSAMSVVSGN